MSKHENRSAVVAVVGVLLVAAIALAWSLSSPNGAPGRVDDGDEQDVRRSVGGVELAQDEVSGAASGVARAQAADVRDAEPGPAAEAEGVGDVPLDVPPDDAMPLAPSKQRLVPIGDGVVFALTVVGPEQIASPRLPAWLELQPRTLTDDSRPRRVLGTISNDTWSFEVRDLEPGGYAWTVRTGVAAPLRGSSALEVGRNELEIVLTELPAVRVDLVASFPWSDESDGELMDVEGQAEYDEASLGAAAFGDRRGETTSFGPGVPWLAFEAARDEDTVLVPFQSWWRAQAGIVALGSEPVFGNFHDVAYVYGLEQPSPSAALLGGLPRTHALEVDTAPGGGRMEARVVELGDDESSLGAFDVEPLSAQSARISVKVLYPESVRDEVPELWCTLYGCVPERLDGPNDTAGPTMWRRTSVPLPLSEESLPFGGVTFDTARIPRGARVMFSAEGMRPVFRDLDELLDGDGVLLEFEPGTGGVLLAAYQNHRAPNAHWGPGFGFEVRRLAEARDGAVTGDWLPGEAASVGDEAPRRVGPMGWLEFASDGPAPFDAAHLVVRRPDTNRARTGRTIHPSLAFTLTDAAPGVVELFVQD